MEADRTSHEMANLGIRSGIGYEQQDPKSESSGLSRDQAELLHLGKAPVLQVRMCPHRLFRGFPTLLLIWRLNNSGSLASWLFWDSVALWF